MANFSADPWQVREIAAAAARLGANLVAVTFHVGSQCRNPESWRLGIERAKHTLAVLRAAGLQPRLLDIGGGFPVRHTEPIPSVEAIGEVVDRALADLPREVSVIADPGAFSCPMRPGTSAE